jgi:delta-aminolevulinic acid dehydratase/porphobilinogen synthase
MTAADERVDRRRQRDDGGLVALKPAGADGMLTYFAPRATQKPE